MGASQPQSSCQRESDVSFQPVKLTAISLDKLNSELRAQDGCVRRREAETFSIARATTLSDCNPGTLASIALPSLTQGDSAPDEFHISTTSYPWKPSARDELLVETTSFHAELCSELQYKPQQLEDKVSYRTWYAGDWSLTSKQLFGCPRELFFSESD